MSDQFKPLIEYEVEADDPAFSAGYGIVEANMGESDCGSPDLRDKYTPFWYGWGIRHAFWAGVIWERERNQELMKRVRHVIAAKTEMDSLDAIDALEWFLKGGKSDG